MCQTWGGGGGGIYTVHNNYYKKLQVINYTIATRGRGEVYSMNIYSYHLITSTVRGLMIHSSSNSTILLPLIQFELIKTVVLAHIHVADTGRKRKFPL